VEVERARADKGKVERVRGEVEVQGKRGERREGRPFLPHFSFFT
jgi:hypothetical protein